MPLAVTRSGSGPEVLLVHGGASAETTWRGLEPLQSRWTLGYVHRRGFSPSPARTRVGDDFEVDTVDLLELLGDRPHVVAHSYGGLSVLAAAAGDPSRVRSVTLIEVPLWFLTPDDPDVAHLRDISDEAMANGADASPAALREFLRIAGSPGVDDGPLPQAVAAGIERARGGRSPSEALLDLAPLRAAGVPVLVASGAHTDAIERVSDATAAALAAERVVAPGAGHFVAAAPGFAERLDAFLAAVTTEAG